MTQEKCQVVNVMFCTHVVYYDKFLIECIYIDYVSLHPLKDANVSIRYKTLYMQYAGEFPPV